MLLENTTVGVIAFGLKKKGSKPILGYPGVSRVSDADWNELSKDKSVQGMLENNKLTVIACRKTKLTGKKLQEENAEWEARAKESGRHLDLIDFDDDQAVSVIKRTMFLPLLKEWLDYEHNPKVQRALHEQIDLVGPTAVKKEKV